MLYIGIITQSISDNFLTVSLGQGVPVDKLVDISIVVVALIACYENALFYWKYRKTNSMHWVKLWYAVISFIWASIFLYTLFGPPVTNARMWHAAIVEPAIIVTLAAIAASAIMRMKVYKEGK